jgi:predicted aminopeptidase
MQPVFKWILDRAQEKTTWLGILGLASTVGWYIDPAVVTQITQAGTAIASLILVVTGERK